MTAMAKTTMPMIHCYFSSLNFSFLRYCLPERPLVAEVPHCVFRALRKEKHTNTKNILFFRVKQTSSN